MNINSKMIAIYLYKNTGTKTGYTGIQCCSSATKLWWYQKEFSLSNMPLFHVQVTVKREGGLGGWVYLDSCFAT